MKKKFWSQQFHRSPPNLCEILAWKTDNYLISNFFVFQTTWFFLPWDLSWMWTEPWFPIDENHSINMRPLTSPMVGNPVEWAWRKACLKRAVLSFGAHLLHSFAQLFVSVNLWLYSRVWQIGSDSFCLFSLFLWDHGSLELTTIYLPSPSRFCPEQFGRVE